MEWKEMRGKKDNNKVFECVCVCARTQTDKHTLVWLQIPGSVKSEKGGEVCMWGGGGQNSRKRKELDIVFFVFFFSSNRPREETRRKRKSQKNANGERKKKLPERLSLRLLQLCSRPQVWSIHVFCVCVLACKSKRVKNRPRWSQRKSGNRRKTRELLELVSKLLQM